ncbi:MAG TPA: hypothetical protein VG099_14055 [Gemmataceae bacterium]|jgi:hypothetical protein|nr:hypothetical protein [Gemmataceae bacterium]
MVIEGVVQNGMIVLDKGATLPEGTRVKVVTESAAVEARPTLTGLLKFAGCMPDMPADFAEQHDHYIHGTPRR